MIKKYLLITKPCKLKIKNSQLVISNSSTGESSSVPVEDIFCVELDSPQILISNYTISFLQENVCALMTCNSHHLPNGLMLPLAGNHIISQRLNKQVAMKLPLKKSLWKDVIYWKIKNQEELLSIRNKETETLKKLRKTIKSNDSGNNESQAAGYYWRNIFDFPFSRDPEGDYPNAHLNYGYSIIRTAVARELAAAGLHPSLGIHHKNLYNAYCLADDIMEPFRPFVDRKIIEIAERGEENLIITKEEKAEIINILFDLTEFKRQKKTIANSIQDVVQLLLKSIEVGESKIKYPVIK